jgi:hypothetical protein
VGGGGNYDERKIYICRNYDLGRIYCTCTYAVTLGAMHIPIYTVILMREHIKTRHSLEGQIYFCCENVIFLKKGARDKLYVANRARSMRYL